MPTTSDSTTSQALSVYLITRNEATHLERVLERVQGADEIVVVDSGSTDDTVAIARRHGARVIHQEWLGYARQKAFALQQCTHLWVLNLDGDEVLPAGALGLIRDRIDAGDVNGIYLSHDDLFFGETLCGHRHRRFCRVYRKDRASWNTDLQVHEHIDVEGPTAVLPITVTHYGYDSVHRLGEKINRYSLLKANQRESEGRGFSSGRLLFILPVMFLKFYVVRRMFLSGRRGFVKAVVEAFQHFLTEAKLYERSFRAERQSGHCNPAK